MARQQEDALREELENDLIYQVEAIRQRRRLVEEGWLRNRRAWMSLFTDRRFVGTDTAPNTYNIPAGRRAAERTIVRGVSMLTPNVKWFEVQPVGDVPSDKLSNVDQFMWYVLRKKIRSRSNINLLVRSMFMYGLCHLKTSIMVRNGQVWPYQRVVDPFAFYIYPETVASMDDAELRFEDSLFSYERYRTLAQKGLVEDINPSDLTKPDWPYHLTERLAYQGITDPTVGVDAARRKVDDQLTQISSAFVSWTELWLPRNDKLYQVYIVWNLKGKARIVGFVQSEYDEPLYRSVLHRPLPGETYTNSMMEDISELNDMQNDLAAQFLTAVDRESGQYGINDQMVSRMDSLKVKGGAIWHFNDDPRQAVNFISPPNTSTNQLRAWQIILGLINALGGTGTIAEGQPGRNMPRAGGAVNSLINLSLADIQDVVELIEQEVLTPSLSDIYKVASEFIPESQLMRIPGGAGLYGNILKKDQILGDYEFEWVGSLQFQDETQRAQQVLVFLNLLIQTAPLLQQQGQMVNIAEMIKFAWRYALGERGLSNIIIPMPQQQGIAGTPTAGSVPSGATSPPNGAGAPAGVPGLQYSLPSATEGFVRQGRSRR